MENKKIISRLTCQIPRKKEAIAALLSLSWKKSKKNCPQWVLEELKSIS
tara:strand:- start:174 stop:320 length:147 start_codon:yes stop_codon:yes gene_type:complete